MDMSPYGNAIPISIVIADDHAIFRDGFEAMLKKEPWVHLIGQACNGKELIKLVEEKAPQIVITDVQMPEMDGIEATRILKKNFPEVAVIALSMFGNESVIIDMFEAGARGYLLKNTSKEEVLYAIKMVKDKGMYYCTTTSNKLVRLMARSNLHPYKKSNAPQFTEREIEIIRWMCQEMCSKEIAAQMNINHRSVESARERILEKIGAKNGIGIVLYAIRHGIFSID